jgi:hypothetical protein
MTMSITKSFATIACFVCRLSAVSANYLQEQTTELEGIVALRNSGDEEPGFETLMRGPLHEAFAEPIAWEPSSGLIVSREPPEDINELPPEYQPEVQDAIWISGYWGWDEDRNDFIWISGVLRVPPAGQRWVPGYWHAVDQGWQWVQGFWVDETVSTIEYLPSPPASLEIGPISPSPGSDYFYIPGHWSQASSNYRWNVGYWHALQEDFIWIPCHYVWTPRGCVFVDGYWDRRLPLRGLCFAPLSVSVATYSKPGWCYRPRVVLNSQAVLHNLFVQPTYCHYMFGDYYGVSTARRRIVPIHEHHQRRGACDPLLSFYTAYNARQGQDLIGWYSRMHSDLSRNPAKRPPQVWSPHDLHDRHLANATRSVGGLDPTRIAHSLEHLQQAVGQSRLSPASRDFKHDSVKNTEAIKSILKERQHAENANVHPTNADRVTQPMKSDIPSRDSRPSFSLPKIDPLRSVDVKPRSMSAPSKPKLADVPRSKGSTVSPRVLSNESFNSPSGEAMTRSSQKEIAKQPFSTRSLPNSPSVTQIQPTPRIENRPRIGPTLENRIDLRPKGTSVRGPTTQGGRLPSIVQEPRRSEFPFQGANIGTLEKRFEQFDKRGMKSAKPSDVDRVPNLSLPTQPQRRMQQPTQGQPERQLQKLPQIQLQRQGEVRQPNERAPSIKSQEPSRSASRPNVTGDRGKKPK